MTSRAPAFALLVTVRVAADDVAAFRDAITRAAAAALAREPDCHRFDVAQDEADPATFVLFEVYSDAEALAVHHRSEHFLAFQRETSSMVVDKTRQRLNLVAIA